ncbi:PEP-CTERM sorting domain-containing protein [Photobacterium sp. BZF1]|uniref:PEP-CTERM sorting domain-containing protein n=1 Tax=Photobacterium sp. BZF1 TaxID=1904457 RepID=UPI0016535DAF|nr:PEP-CTERM sorting domain-containing protein [Photobacterium sp. BZF1]MBC7004452.1 PEP-CTERM sorting domain-containing protein [Photobacterium sp. BZF1]
MARTTKIILFVVLTLFSRYSFSGIIQTYDDRSIFESLTGNNGVFTFGSPPSITENTVGDTYDYGPFTVTTEYNRSAARHTNGAWRGKPSFNQNDIFMYDNPLSGWGGFINTREGGNGVGIEILVDFGDNIIELAGGVGIGRGANSAPNNGYFGFTTDMPFQKVILRSWGEDGPNRSDTYKLSNVSNISAEIPEPATGLLVLASVLGLVRMRRNAVS